jgi:hypothetical protein
MKYLALVLAAQLAAGTLIAPPIAKASPMDLPSVKAKVEAQVRAAWPKVEKKADADPQKAVVWSAQLSPALPLQWPPQGDGALVIDVYALGQRTSLRDGAIVAAPWTRARVSSDGTVALDAVSALEEIGVQGVRPVSPALFDKLAAAEQELATAVAGRTLPSGSSLRDGYCGWLRFNGVIAGRLKARNPAFFDWLACDKPAK